MGIVGYMELYTKGEILSMKNNIEYCPICGSSQLMNQPYPGINDFIIYYECGSEITYILSEDRYVIEQECKKGNLL